MRKILVFNVNWLGDVIFSSPVFRALHEAYPDAEIVCAVVSRVADIARQIPFVDRVIVYDEKGVHRSLFGKISIVYRLRKEKFDILFLLRGSFTRALLCFLAGIPVRVGYATKKRTTFLTHVVAPASQDMHRSDQYLRVVESFSVNVKERQTQITIPSEANDFSQKFFEKNNIGSKDFFVVLNPGGNWDLKRWPKQNFICLAQRLTKEFNAKVGICGALSDKDLAKNIAQACQLESSSHNLICFAGETKILQLAAIFQKASLVISADSGPLHIASSVGTKTIALFGPTHPQVTGARGPGVSAVIRYDVGCNDKPCYQLNCQDNICMKAIGVCDVIQKVKELYN